MELFQVAVNKDDSVRVARIGVIKETRLFYYIESRASLRDLKWSDPKRAERDAFGYSDRVDKSGAFTTPRAALENYMTRRQRDKSNAQAVVAQATKQIASANELLMKEPLAADAVDPVGEKVTDGPRA